MDIRIFSCLSSCILFKIEASIHMKTATSAAASHVYRNWPLIKTWAFNLARWRSWTCLSFPYLLFIVSFVLIVVLFLDLSWKSFFLTYFFNFINFRISFQLIFTSTFLSYLLLSSFGLGSHFSFVSTGRNNYWLCRWGGARTQIALGFYVKLSI